MSIIDDVYSAVAHAILGIHRGLEPIFGTENGFGWALSIVLLTVAVRLVLFPLFVKQIKTQRTMQMLQPRMKEIREKHKNNRQKMNEEVMKLQREHGNPLLGCLPVLAQAPLFIALFRVLNGFQPKLIDGHYRFVANHGLGQHDVQTIGSARIFGVPLSAAFRSSSNLLDSFHPPASSVAVRIVCLILIVVMCTTTFITQKQVMGRNGPVDPSQQAQQKIFLYLAPGLLGISGFLFPVGVLVYWMTTNFWSMGQQFFVIRKMPVTVPGSPAAAALPARAPRRGGLLRLGTSSETPAATPESTVRLRQARGVPELPGPTQTGPGAAKGASQSEENTVPPVQPVAVRRNPGGSGKPPNKRRQPPKSRRGGRR